MCVCVCVLVGSNAIAPEPSFPLHSRLTFTDVYYRITPKLFRCGTSVRVQRETSHDIVTCAASGSSTSGVEVWDGDPFTTRMLGEELVIVFTASTAGDAKFWFKAEGE